jgi:putative ABC transport system permease protein
MRPLRVFWIRLTGVFAPGRRAQQFDDELRSHLELHIEDNVRRGMAPDEARRQALIALGGTQTVRDAYRDRGGLPFLESLAQDIRFATRMLSKSPGFALVAILILALGIGANAAMFSLVNALLLRPLNGGNLRGQLVGLYSGDRTRPDRFRPFSYPEYVDIRQQNDVFEQLLAEAAMNPDLTEGEITRQVRAGLVSSNYFSTLGVDLAAGRAFTLEEERPESAAAVTIVSYTYWRQHGLTPDILGRSINVNGHALTIVGVAPPGFNGTMPVMSADLWLPFGAGALVVENGTGGPPTGVASDRTTRTLLISGTLKAGTSADAAETRLSSLAAAFEAAYPQYNGNQRLVVHARSRVSMGPQPRSDAEPMAGAILLMVVAGLVLLVASLNLANVLLARGARRRQEIAIRVALGGGRLRIIRQLLIEGLLLSFMSGVAALLVSWWATSRVLSSLTAVFPMPIFINVSPDIRVVTAVAVACVVSTLVFALGPAVRLSRPDVITVLKQSAPVGASRARRLGLPAVLVGSQVAISLTLLLVAGVFLRAGLNAASSDPGFPLAGKLLAEIDTRQIDRDQARRRVAHAALLDRVRAVPNVAVASLASIIPFGDERDGRVAQRGNATTFATFTVIGADYCGVFGLPLVAGREFTVAEEQDASSEPVAIVDRVLAQRLFAQESPIGQWLRLTARDQPEELLRIVGVVASVRDDVLEPPAAHVYVPFGRHYRDRMTLTVKTAGGSEGAMLEPVRDAIQGVDARLRILSLKTMTNHRDMSASLWAVTLAAKLFVAFGIIAAMLTTAGVYGLRAYLVTQRAREIGIRIALGATRRTVMRQLLKEGTGIAATGLAVGAVLAVGLIQLLRQSGMLYQVDAIDPLVFTVASLVLAAATAAASYVPARRALRGDPTVALRAE